MNRSTKSGESRKQLIETFLSQFKKKFDYQFSVRVQDYATQTVVFLDDLFEESPRFTIRPLESKSWLSLQSLNCSVFTPNAENNDSLTEFLRSLKAFVVAKDESFAEYSHVFSYDDGEALYSEESPPANINWAAFHVLRILKNEPRLGNVTRIIDGRKEIWHSSPTIILGEIYPWVSLTGEQMTREEIGKSWKAYAQSYEDHQKPLSIYIHIPFCAYKCHFCHCAVTVLRQKTQLDAYVDSICAELESFHKDLKDIPVDSIFMGGGTPSVLSAAALGRIAATLKKFRLVDNIQFTMEANPDSMTAGKIKAICEHVQLNRLTVGIQTIDPEAQATSNRFNRIKKIKEIVNAARENRVEIINFDLLAGLDDLSLEGFQSDLKQASDLQPEIIKIYAFRPFRFLPGSERIVIDEAQFRSRNEQIKWADGFLREHGRESFGQTADKNPEQKNRQTVGNEGNRVGLLGVGVSAVSYIPGQLFYETPMNIQLFAHNGESLPYPAYGYTKVEEFHSFLVRSLQDRMSVSEISGRFDVDDLSEVLSFWEELETLGLVKNQGKYELEFEKSTNLMLAKFLLTSQAFKDKLENKWGSDFQPDFNYVHELHKIYDGPIAHYSKPVTQSVSSAQRA